MFLFIPLGELALKAVFGGNIRNGCRIISVEARAAELAASDNIFELGLRQISEGIRADYVGYLLNGVVTGDEVERLVEDDDAAQYLFFMKPMP